MNWSRYTPMPRRASPMPPGTVQITPEKQQLIGVKFAQVEMAAAPGLSARSAEWRSTRPASATSAPKWKAGFRTVFVDYMGQLVQKSAALMTIYSPEMLAAERELLLVAKAAGGMKDTSLPGAFDQSEALLQAARRRLELWDLTRRRSTRC